MDNTVAWKLSNSLILLGTKDGIPPSPMGLPPTCEDHRVLQERFIDAKDWAKVRAR